MKFGKMRKLKINWVTLYHKSVTYWGSGSCYLIYTVLEGFISANIPVEKKTEKMTMPIFPAIKAMKSFALCFGYNKRSDRIISIGKISIFLISKIGFI